MTRAAVVRHGDPDRSATVEAGQRGAGYITVAGWPSLSTFTGSAACGKAA